MKYDILLHACCGICAGYPIQMLQESGFKLLVYFSNDNIDTLVEYNKRKDALITLCNYFFTDYIIDSYKPEYYLEKVVGFEKEPERGKRCIKCISMRLGRAAEKAYEMGVKAFTTTLVISPYKSYDMITSIGEELSTKYSLEYLGINFKKKDGFLKTNAISKKLGLYRQNYCGCSFAKL